MTDSVSVLIPVYIINEELLQMTDRCLFSLFAHTPSGVEVIVVDDGSPTVYDADFGKTIRLEQNSGYSKAANTALEAATGDILVLGNNDIIFHENWLTELLFPLQLGFDIASCWTSDQQGVVIEDRVESGSKFGALFAMHRKVYDTLGGFDEQFRGRFSDTDYRRRALDAGFTLGKNLSMVVEHKAAATHRTVDPDDEEFLRNQRLYEIKWGVAE